MRNEKNIRKTEMPASQIGLRAFDLIRQRRVNDHLRDVGVKGIPQNTRYTRVVASRYLLSESATGDKQDLKRIGARKADILKARGFNSDNGMPDRI